MLTELITGGALIVLLAVCGNWLIGRGLAPLRRMASTADLITRSGDLAARMPDATEAAGSGLGLSIVQAIAVAHGGRAELSSAPGEGTTIRVWIPIRNQQ